MSATSIVKIPYVIIVPCILPTAPPETVAAVGVADIIRQLISSLPPLQVRFLITLIIANQFALSNQARYFFFFYKIQISRRILNLIQIPNSCQTNVQGVLHVRHSFINIPFNNLDFSGFPPMFVAYT
jgi:hypothetical protein